MPITVYTQPQLKAILATSYAAKAKIPANTDPGSSLGSFMDADTILLLNVQNQILTAQAISRLASSKGADVDSFVNPFGVFRIGSSPSSGGVTLTAPSPVGSTLVIPVNGVLQTTSGLLFLIVADLSNPDFSAPDNGYLITAGNTSCIVTVVCETSGSVGNVAIGQISQPYNGSGIPIISGITGISNADAFEDGIDQENDPQLKIRFTFLVSTGRVATGNAIIGSAMSVQAGLTVSYGNRKNADGSLHTAFFTLVVNALGQSTGPGEPLIDAVTSAVDLVDSAGISFLVVGPTLIPVNGAATIKVDTANGFDPTVVVPAVTAAYVNYLNNIGMDVNGGTTEVDLFSVGCVLLDVPGVKKIDGLTLNSGTADIVAPFANQLVAGSQSFTAA